MVRLRKHQGFTLIEMMVVMAIIALIAVFAVPNITNALQNSRVKSVESQARQIQNAFDQYYNDNNDYPAQPTTATYDGTAGSVSAEDAYVHFFGDGDMDSNANTAATVEGALMQYLSLDPDIGDSLFIPRSYAYIAGAGQTSPQYELVIEVKNVNTTNKYIHITKNGILRLSDDATNAGAYDQTAGNHSDALQGTLTGSWVGS